jgi:MoaA/NifB/PqqE/SkfB family radical SAM enzyme
MRDDLDPKIGFSWDIHWSCNYRCPYCWWHGRWEEISEHNRYPGIIKLIETWERIYRQYGPVHIEISGGEPLIYPEFCEFLEMVLPLHSIGIATNLSTDIEQMIERLGQYKDNLRIGATFHPLFAEFYEFTRKASRLREAGLSIGISYLAWPPQIEKIPIYRERFAKIGFNLSVLTFWGKYAEKAYPGAYTQEEKKIISPSLGSRGGESFQTKPLITQGKLCNAGHIYATIHPDGEAIRCGGGSWERQDEPIGNIFDDDFRLLEGPRPCTSRFCPCNEWAFLLVKR